MSDVPSRAEIAADMLENLPDLIHEARARRGLSLRGVAAEAGVSYQSIFLLEHGSTGTARVTCIKLIRWLDQPGTRNPSVTRSPPITNADRVTPA